MTRLVVVPMELKDANAFVDRFHRHHKPVQGHRFSIGCRDEHDELHGVSIVGRPVARMVNPRTTLEVTRLCTDGTSNACSFLYAASARIGKALGYLKIQTYILEHEAGSSLLASGWEYAGATKGAAWVHTDGVPRSNTHPLCDKQKFEKVLNGGAKHV